MYIKKLYKKKIALIFGITGQDGVYLTKLLLDKGYKVFGTSRYIRKNFLKFKFLEIKQNVKIYKINPNDINEVKKCIKLSKCNEIYYFSGISSVAFSNKFLEKTLNDNIKGLTNILEICRTINNKIRIYHASSSECFGSSRNKINENSDFSPNSPYALSKVINSYLIQNYRNNLNLWAVNGFTFNHDSNLRPNNFVLKKIANYIKSKHKKKLKVGNLNIIRDWGLASEYVEFMYKIMQENEPEDYIIGKGKSENLKSVINYYFKKYNISTKKIKIIKDLIRKNDIKLSYSDPKKLKKKFNKLPTSNVRVVINKMLNNEFY